MDLSELIYIDETGYHYPDYPTILTWLQGRYRTIYGEDVYLEPDSQDGQFLAVLAKSFYDMGSLGASVYSSFSPVSAQGTGLSRLVKINGISRGIATHSSVDLTIVGSSGTTIKNGVALDSLNQKWDLPSSVVIPPGGTVTVTAVAQESGDITAAASTVNKIFTPTLGWQTVNNPSEATPGAPVESDAELRTRQAQSTALPALTVLDATLGAIENLDGVLRAQGYENDTGSTDSNGIPAHSICMVVQGGDSDEIATAIARKKTQGTGTFGTTTELVYDSRGMPVTIKFSRPDVLRIEATVTISQGTGWTADYEPLIKQAVADTINALGIGKMVFYTKLFAPSYLPGNPAGLTYDVVTIEINIFGNPPAEANIPVAFDEVAECDVDDVTVVVT